jgi:tRNA(adenine34) deaminase
MKTKTPSKRKGKAVGKAKSASRRWVAAVMTDSTHPPKGLFTRSAATIANSLSSKRVSPKGPSSGMRMLNYFINRAGKSLTAERRRVLKHAKTLLSKKIKTNKIRHSANKANSHRKSRASR